MLVSTFNGDYHIPVEILTIKKGNNITKQFAITALIVDSDFQAVISTPNDKIDI